MVTPNEVEAEEVTGVSVKDLESAKKAAAILGKRVSQMLLLHWGPEAYLFLQKVKR